jgi:26S proteasome regulatory subunit T5
VRDVVVAHSNGATMAVDDVEEDQIASMSTEQIITASRLLDNEIRVHKVCRPSVKP